MTLQYRQITGGEVRAAVVDDSAHEIEAKVCSYGVGPDTYNTTWQRGCFDAGLRSSLPAVCWSHQSDAIIGSVVGYRDEPDGLYVRMRLADFDAVPDARRAYSLIKDGHVRGWSFGFADGVTVPDKEHRGALAFTAATMYEVSPVLRASVPDTHTVSVRAQGNEPVAPADVVAEAVRQAMASGQDLRIRVADGEITLGLAASIPAPAGDDDGDRSDGDGGDSDTAEGDRSENDPDAELTEDEAAEAERAADELTDSERAKKPYGDVAYADPKNGKYPIDTKAHAKAAWAYVNQSDNAAEYPLNGVTLAEVKAKIKAAAKKFGIEISDDRAVEEAELRAEFADLDTRLGILAVL